MEELTITLNISDRNYRLSVEREHEELFRRAAKLIDQRIRDYSSNYAYKDKQDLLSMVALEYTTRFLQDEDLRRQQERNLEARLTEIDHNLDLVLQQ